MPRMRQFGENEKDAVSAMCKLNGYLGRVRCLFVCYTLSQVP